MYTQYISFLHACNTDENIRRTFKSHPSYRGILEHVSYEQGLEYIEYIEKNTDITRQEIVGFCALNDMYGMPITYRYYKHLDTSPTNFRYILHAYLILQHYRSFGKEFDIVEIGGGYGGLALALWYFANKYNVNFRSYTIIDLFEATLLQTHYLHTMYGRNEIICKNAMNFGEDIDTNENFLISNYCFSEISYDYQEAYRRVLFPKVIHGFMCWNFIPLYDFGIPLLRQEPEYPRTSPENMYIYF